MIESNSTKEKFNSDIKNIIDNEKHDSTHKKATVITKRCNRELKKNIMKRREIKRNLILEYFDEYGLKEKFENERTIYLILDNYSTHRSKFIGQVAEILNIKLIFLPPYSPQLNRIEQVWKDMKRELKKTYIKSLEFLKKQCKLLFNKVLEENTYTGEWVEKFII